MPFMSKNERERAELFFTRYNISIPHDDFMLYVASIYSEGRQDERRACVKVCDEIEQNALKSQRQEVGKSESGMQFQSGRRKGAEDIRTRINGRNALPLSKDEVEVVYEGTPSNERKADT